MARFLIDCVGCRHQCTVTCGQGLRYRVVLCIDHRGLHAGGCNPTTKPHIKEECLVTVPCYKSMGKPFRSRPNLWTLPICEIKLYFHCLFWVICSRYAPSWGETCVAQAGDRAGGGDHGDGGANVSTSLMRTCWWHHNFSHPCLSLQSWMNWFRSRSRWPHKTCSWPFEHDVWREFF